MLHYCGTKGDVVITYGHDKKKGYYRWGILLNGKEFNVGRDKFGKATQLTRSLEAMASWIGGRVETGVLVEEGAINEK